MKLESKCEFGVLGLEIGQHLSVLLYILRPRVHLSGLIALLMRCTWQIQTLVYLKL